MKRRILVATGLVAVVLVSGVGGVDQGAARATPTDPTAKRMVGGGWIPFAGSGSKIRFAVELWCTDPTDMSGRSQSSLVIESRNANVHVHLDEVFSNGCEGERKLGGFSDGTGTGRCNGEPATVSWLLQDSGHDRSVDARKDQVLFMVSRSEAATEGGPCAMSYAGHVEGGNLTLVT